MKKFHVGFNFAFSFSCRNTFIQFSTPWHWRPRPYRRYVGEHWTTCFHKPEILYGSETLWEIGWFKLTRYAWTPAGIAAEKKLDEEFDKC